MSASLLWSLERTTLLNPQSYHFMAKPNFTGTWKFNQSKSALQIPAPESTTFVIAHSEPHFHLQRTHVFDGNSDTFSIDLTTDGKVVVIHHGGFEMHARADWEGEALVFYSTLERGGEQATNIVRYSLADDGQTFIAEERFQSQAHQHENKWVFDKQ